MLWFGEVLEPMDAEIAHHRPDREIAPEEIGSRLREENLSTVARRHDACPLMQGQAGVAFLCAKRLPRMDAHAHANREVPRPGMIHEPLLRFDRGPHRLRRSAEDHEEGISLGIDLDALVALDGAPQELPVGFEEGRVAITRLEQ